MQKIIIGEVLIEYDSGNVRIVDSYKIKNEKWMRDILFYFIMKTGYKSRRSINSWIREWKAHNRVYKLGMFKKRTKDCDLEEGEKLYRRIIYWIIGGI